MLSFYTAKLEKIKSLKVRKKMVKNVIFTKRWDITKCIEVIVLRISRYINHTLGFLLGPSKCLYYVF